MPKQTKQKREKKKENFIARSLFQRKVKQITRPLDMSEPMKYSKEALELFHEKLEQYLLKLFRQANVAANHAGRTTIFTNDLGLLRNVCYSEFDYDFDESDMRQKKKR